MEKYSFLNAVHTSNLEELYQKYIDAPDEIEPSWRAFFQGYDLAIEEYDGKKSMPEEIRKEFKVIDLINAYRNRGHLFTATNPVRERRKHSPTLDIENFGLTPEDLSQSFEVGKWIGLKAERPTLADIISHLKKVYCKSIGLEYMYVRSPEEMAWVQERIHQNENQPDFTPAQKKKLLGSLSKAVMFENFLHTKFVGQKRFSLEGCEALIPALKTLLEHSAGLGVEEAVMGMAHRGRLNVLANILGKTYRDIFSEFEEKDFDDALFDGDVKYHLGWSTDAEISEGKTMRLNLAPNPSHLEAVDPLVGGISRAKIDRYYAGNEGAILPIIIHGDAAIAGQGVVYETVQMMHLSGYCTGGTIHIVINNQIGFTTNYTDARSSTYCTDIAKVNLCPVIHVNADDIESVAHTMIFAAEYRKRFKKDIFIDLLGYRRYGHNEGDEPRFTQPKLYAAIASHPNPKEIYTQKLIEEGTLLESEVKARDMEFKNFLDRDFQEAIGIEYNKITPFMGNEWQSFKIVRGSGLFEDANTGVEEAVLTEVSKKLSTIPQGWKFLRKIDRILSARWKMFNADALDWSMGEMLAYGTLLKEGYHVRVSGQDVERGTFSHRHAILKAEDSEEEINLLNQDKTTSQGDMYVYNSLLSEYGVLGFDYGYAMASPSTLAVWEAQFGDFSNGAQIMIDQYISSAEDKWKVQNGIVMLLPHGYEGNGAEHSSARMERYLQLCAEDNMILANCTTPANFFHILRRQMKARFRKPLIVFTPKSLLRHPQCVSPRKDFIGGSTFQYILDDPKAASHIDKITHVLLCTGKIYYDLCKERDDRGIANYAIIRVEQLYPFPVLTLGDVLSKYHRVSNYTWVQEEPENMGAWGYLLRKLPHLNLRLVSLPESAVPATGSHARFTRDHHKVLRRAFSSPLLSELRH